jgi:hypothetical protein
VLNKPPAISFEGLDRFDVRQKTGARNGAKPSPLGDVRQKEREFSPLILASADKLAASDVYMDIGILPIIRG